MAQSSDGQYKFDVKLTQEEYKKLVVPDDGSDVFICTVILAAGYGRTCPGRKGAACRGDGNQPLELRNMGKPDAPKWEVRDQSSCQKCRK